MLVTVGGGLRSTDHRLVGMFSNVRLEDRTATRLGDQGFGAHDDVIGNGA